MAINSAERAVQILFTFTTDEPLLGINDISKKTDISPSTVHHLVQSLIPSGLIEQDPMSKKYRLGIRTIELGGTMLRSRNLTAVSEPILHQVADEIDETAYLGVLDNGDLLNLEQACTRHPVHYCGWQGRRTPYYCTSAGKVLAAHLNEDELQELLDQKELLKYTQQTITDKKVLIDELEKIRDQGYALSIREYQDQNNAVAVPIRYKDGIPINENQNNPIIAALGVVGPAYRFSVEKCIDAVPVLKSFAADISRAHTL